MRHEQRGDPKDRRFTEQRRHRPRDSDPARISKGSLPVSSFPSLHRSPLESVTQTRLRGFPVTSVVDGVPRPKIMEKDYESGRVTYC